MNLRHRYETLLLYDPNRSPLTVNVWLAHPTAAEEQVLGKLVVVSQVNGTDRVNLDVINLIQEELRTTYYQAVDAKPERAFEHALQRTNQRLHQVITDGVSTWVNEANFMVAAVWRDELVMSVTGVIHAYLLRRGQIHDIVGPPEATKPNPVRFFGALLTGQLQTDDQVLICTPTLLDYFSLEKLRRTLLEHSPAEAVHQWETTLLGIEQRSAFAATIIDVQAEAAAITAVSRPVIQSTLSQSAPQVSMEHLIAKEQATERLLAPSIWPAIRDLFGQIGRGLNRFIRRVVFRKPPRRTLPSMTGQFATPPPAHPLVLGRIGARLAGWGLQVVNVIRALWRRPPGMAAPEPMTMAPILRRRWHWPSLNRLIRWFQGLRRQQQWLVLASIVVVVIFAVSLVRTLAPSTTATPSASAATEIADHIAKAQAALLYGGEATAHQHLTAAQALVNRLPNRSKQDKTQRQSTIASLDRLTEQLAHRIVPDTVVVSSLATVVPQFQPRQLYVVGSRLAAYDPDRGVLVAQRLGQDEAPVVISQNLDTGQPTTGAVTGTSAITFATDRGTFAEVDLAKATWRAIDSAFPKRDPRIQSLSYFQGRLYTLDTNHEDIVRFSRAANTLGTGVPWLKETANLKSARSAVVDGSIYVLQPGGVVEKYFGGRRGSLTLATITPPLTNATRLWTDVTSKYLYLADPGQPRIVLFEKNGALFQQYTSSAWQNLTDIAVSETTDTVYVLSGTTITSFRLQPT